MKVLILTQEEGEYDSWNWHVSATYLVPDDFNLTKETEKILIAAFEGKVCRKTKDGKIYGKDYYKFDKFKIEWFNRWFKRIQFEIDK